MPIAVWSTGNADHAMDEQILVRLSEITRTHPWWTSRLKITLDCLRKYGVRRGDKLIDAGCGWGLNYLSLLERGYDVTGADISRRVLDRLDAPGRKLALADLAAPNDAAPDQFDCGMMLDVIEHVDDDRAALQGLNRLLRPGGLMIVSVPALPELMGEFDRIQQHRRRYTPESLKAAFDFEGIDLLEIFWWGQFQKHIIQWMRRESKGLPGEPAEAVYERYLKLPRRPARWALSGIMAVDRAMAKRRRSTIGTSLWAIARKSPATAAARGSDPAHVLSRRRHDVPSTADDALRPVLAEPRS